MRLTEQMKKICPVLAPRNIYVHEKCQVDACAAWKTTHSKDGFRYGFCKLIDTEVETKKLNNKGVWVA